jgi:hypothetical protein
MWLKNRQHPVNKQEEYHWGEVKLPGLSGTLYPAMQRFYEGSAKLRRDISS